MTLPLVVIRPQPGNAATVALAQELGMHADGFAMLAVRAIAWQAPPRDSFDALLIGSANALRHGGDALLVYSGMPAYVVGQATGEAARSAGLVVVASGEGGLQSVVNSIQPDHHRLLRLCGQARIDLTCPEHVTITERIVYAAEPLAMPGELAAILADPAVILLHSAEAARHFVQQCDQHNISRNHLALAAMGPRIANAAGAGWAQVASASLPNDQALLALARQMCQKDGQGS